MMKIRFRRRECLSPAAVRSSVASLHSATNDIDLKQEGHRSPTTLSRASNKRGCGTAKHTHPLGGSDARSFEMGTTGLSECVCTRVVGFSHAICLRRLGDGRI